MFRNYCNKKKLTFIYKSDTKYDSPKTVPCVTPLLLGAYTGFPA